MPYTTLNYITLHYITLHYITLHYTTLHCIALHYITLHCLTLHYITLHYITLHCIALHYITLHYITLHYITLYYTTLHYITFNIDCAPSFLSHCVNWRLVLDRDIFLKILRFTFLVSTKGGGSCVFVRCFACSYWPPSVRNYELSLKSTINIPLTRLLVMLKLKSFFV